MNLASSPVDRPDVPLFTDGVGDRSVAPDATTGELLQILRLRPALTAVPSFEFALRERTARLMNFRHAYYARVRRIDRLQANGSLAVVSDHVEGVRLADILRVAQSRRIQLDTSAALCLIRQLVPAIALLHENVRDASHGLIGPERIVVTPHARLVLVEHVLGSAIEQLQFGRERLWQEFRVALPSSAGISRFDHRADVNGIGVTALSLVLGRPLAADEFPHAIPSLLMQARERSPYGDERPLSNAFRNWLARTLQLDVRRAYASAVEALSGLEEALASDSSYVAAPVALETFLSQYVAATNTPPAVAPAPAPAPVPVPAAPAAVTPVVSIAPAVPPIAPSKIEIAAPRLVTAPPPAARAVAPPAASVAAAPAVQAAASPADVDVPPRLEQLPTLADLIKVNDLKPVVDAVQRDAAARQPERAVDPEPVRAPLPAPQPSPASSPFEGLDEVLGDVRRDVLEEVDAVEPVIDGPAPPQRGSRGRLVAIIAIVIALGGGVLASRYYTSGAAAPALGTLVVQSSPAGVEVFVDGVARGMTPARLSLAAGSHILELRGRGVPRVIPLQVPAGGQISQYLEFADTPMTGLLVVHSQPAGAKITVDGIARGVTPLTLEGMSPGDHEVVLQNEAGTSKHVVKVLAGTTASLVAPVI